MPNVSEALSRFSDSLSELSDQIDNLAVQADDVASDLTDTDDFGTPAVASVSSLSQPGVHGVQSNDTKVIESVLRIAQVVGQAVVIDYVDEVGVATYDRRITVESFTDNSYGLGSVVADDESRDGGTRRFRIDRIRKVVV